MSLAYLPGRLHLPLKDFSLSGLTPTTATANDHSGINHSNPINPKNPSPTPLLVFQPYSNFEIIIPQCSFENIPLSHQQQGKYVVGEIEISSQKKTNGIVVSLGAFGWNQQRRQVLIIVIT